MFTRLYLCVKSSGPRACVRSCVCARTTVCACRPSCTGWVKFGRPRPSTGVSRLPTIASERTLENAVKDTLYIIEDDTERSFSSWKNVFSELRPRPDTSIYQFSCAFETIFNCALKIDAAPRLILIIIHAWRCVLKLILSKFLIFNYAGYTFVYTYIYIYWKKNAVASIKKSRAVTT